MPLEYALNTNESLAEGIKLPSAGFEPGTCSVLGTRRICL